MRVLITGASGLLGGALAGHLADGGHSVLAMTGRKPVLSDRPARRWDGASPGPGEILFHPADLRQDELGFRGAAPVDLIVHCAGITAFGQDAATYRAVNVDGTARVLGLARRGGTPLLHVSTAYVCGEHDGPVAESPPAPGTSFANAYEASKAEAEGLVAAAMAQGHPAVIARPSIVVGAWADGAIARFDNVYGLIRLVTEGRIRTLPATGDASLDLVPLDHVVGGLADIAERMEAAAGQILHLVSGAPVPVRLLRDLALSYPQFEAPSFVLPAAFDPARLDRREATWFTTVTGLYETYLRRDPRFSDGNLRALSGRGCPPVDWGFLRRMIDRCVEQGFLRSALQRTSG